MLLVSHRFLSQFLPSFLNRSFHKYWVLSILILGCLCGSHSASAQTFTLPATSSTGLYTITWSGTTNVGYIDENQNGTWVRVGGGSQSGSAAITKTANGTYTYRLENCTGSQSGLSCVVVAGTKSITVTLSSGSSSSSSGCVLGTGNTTSYCYDELGRVKSVRYPNGVINTYSYDAADNRTKKESN